MRYAVLLNKLTEKDLQSIGGKGKALAEMARRGLSVPKTLCIHADAYRDFVSQSGLKSRIAVEIGRKDFHDMRWEEIWDASLRIRNLFLNTPFPPDLSRFLADPIESLFKGQPVVVRSSALDEDSAQRSFAGLHESYVNIRGTESVLEHVRLVWASLWSDAALLYRRELGLDVNKSAMAVVILEMVAGEKSGVAFGMAPDNSAHTLIESVYGLNQGMVDGTVEPDRWALERRSGNIISHNSAERKEEIVPVPGGTAKQILAPERAFLPPLNEEEIGQVYSLVMETESIFGAPQDVEWTWKGDALSVLQSRAITTSITNTDDENKERPWYLSLRRSYENLIALRSRIEDSLIPAMNTESAEMAETDLSSISGSSLADELEKRINSYKKWKKIYRDEFIPYAHGIRLFGMFYNDSVKPADPYEFMGLLQNTGIEAVTRNTKLESIASMVRTDPELAEELKSGKTGHTQFNNALSDFLRTFGDISWSGGEGSMNESALIHIIREMASGPEAEKKEMSAPPSELENIFLESVPEEKKMFAKELLDLARSSFRMRDNDNIYLAKIRGQLERAADAYANSLPAGAEQSAESEVLKAAHDLLDEESAAPKEQSETEGVSGFRLKARQIVGQPSGPGIATGTARIVRDSSDLFSFQKGEVLVCDAIDPSMTIIVPLASAIVERRGGMLIHGAIIAREYGIPCVTGIPDATVQIQSGDPVTVDGHLGIVIIG